MERERTIEQYRAIDLTLFAVILAISEMLIVAAATRWFPEQLYTVSVTAAVVSIVLMRWNGYAALHMVLGGLAYCAAARAAGQQYIIYGLGNLAALVSLLWLRLLGAERIRKDGFLSVVFGIATLLEMQLGRAGAAMLLGHPARDCLGFITTDALSALFTGVILWVARRLDGIFENQKHYLLRIHEKDTWAEEKGGF